MAGAIGNMTDRLTRHRVTDFLDLTLFPNTHLDKSWAFGPFHAHITLPYNWPIFNLADSFVVVGTIILILVLLLSHEKSIEQVSSPQLPALAKEGLAELPLEGEAEGLVPLEEADSIRAERLEEPFPSTSTPDSSLPPDEHRKLDEMRRT